MGNEGASDARIDARVGIDARYLNGRDSGIGRYTNHVVRELLELDPTIRLHLITHPNRPEPITHPRVTCRVFPAPANSLRTRWLLGRVLDTSALDLFHSPYNFLPAGVDVPEVFTLHDIMWLINPDYCAHQLLERVVSGTFYQAFIPRSVREADRLLTVSHHSREEIASYFPSMEGRIDVSYNGVDPYFRPVAPARGWPIINKYVPPRQPFVLSVGQGTPYKNHAGALAGFIEAFRDDPEVYYVLVRRRVGRREPELQRLLSDPAIRSRVVYLEYISGRELRALYSLARVFLFPSFYEGFGLPSLEAMACGTPVVTSDRGAPREVGAPAAICVDPESPRAIGEATASLVYDDDFYAEKRQEALEHAGQFTWERCARQVYDCYRHVLGETAGEPTSTSESEVSPAEEWA